MQLLFLHAQAAELIGLHTKAKQVQPRDYIAGNKRVMTLDLTARKQQRLQAEQPRAIECTAQKNGDMIAKLF